MDSLQDGEPGGFEHHNENVETIIKHPQPEISYIELQALAHQDGNSQSNELDVKEPESPSTRESIGWKYTLLSSFVVVGCYFSNLSFVFGRSSTAIIGTQMVREKLITETEFGQIVAAGMCGMFFGAFGFGMIMDYVGTRYPTLISIVIGLVLMILIYFFNGFWSLIIIFLIFNLFAMTAHGSMSKVAREWVHPSRHGFALGFMATSSNVGRIVGLVILGIAYQLGMHWKYSTWIVSGFLCVVFIYYIVIFILEYTFKKSHKMAIVKKSHPLDGKSLKDAIKYFVASGRFWIALIISGCSNSAMDVFSFLPLFVVQTFGVSTGYASIASSLFALGSSISIFLVGWAEDRISKLARVILYGVMLSIGALISLCFIWPFGGFYVTTILLFFLGLMIAPSSYVSYNMFLVNFGGPYAGTLYSVVETCGSLTKVGFDLLQGYIIHKYGFQTFWILSTVVCAVNMVSCVIFLFILYRSPNQVVEGESINIQQEENK